MVDDPVLKQRHEFHHPSDDMLIVESWVDPGGGVTPHVHPTQHERFEVLEGECTFTVGRDKVVKRAGEVAEVPPGTRHAYANKGTAQLHMRCEVTPPLTLEAFLTDVAAMSRAGPDHVVRPAEGLARAAGRHGAAEGLPRHGGDREPAAVRAEAAWAIAWRRWARGAASSRAGSRRPSGSRRRAARRRWGR